MQPFPNKQYAIQLIKVNEDGKYILTQQGAQFISKIPSPIAVVSVAGMYRTGKSYLLNRMLLNRCNGFGVGPTVNPCTKGLWCWSRTVPGKTIEDESVNVIIIDTEGIGALDEDQTHDTRIFTLAILAASSFIYNSTGSIDQNALQNLSLVVNLTKNIQLNTLEKEDEEDDPEELAEYFPSFYWVVRDFALQLTTADGDPISPKEYLQRALAPQKGFSDDIEEKNRIRRLLSTFFRQRECFTMVRPLVDQNKLQHLDKLDLDELRPEFVEQAMNFRKRVLTKIKPKLLRGKQLNGQMYLCLLNSYVSAINNGAVPNIQNAWNYMCQEQCAKAFEQGLGTFNIEFATNFKSHLPIQEQYLLDYLAQLKERCCEEFEKKAIGDQVKFHLKELSGKLQHKIQQIKSENEKLSQIILKKHFKTLLVEIQNKLKLREYKKFEEFNRDINEFYVRILETGPNLPKKQLIYLELIKRVVPMAAQIFLKEKSQEFEQYRSISSEKEEVLLRIQESLKRQLQEESESSKQKITALDRQIIELKLCVDDYKATKQKISEQLEKREKNYTQTIKEKQQDFQKQTEIYVTKIETLTESINNLQNQLSMNKYEEQKKVAVLQMKIKQLEENLQEARKKQSALDLALKSQQISSIQENKEQSEKFQYEIKSRQLQISNLNTTLSELEEERSHQVLQMSEKISKLEQNIANLQEEAIKKESNLKKQVEELQSTYSESSENQAESIKKIQKELESYREKCLNLEKDLQKSNDDFTKRKNQYKTQIAVLEQKVGFLQTENAECQEELGKVKKMYQAMVEQDRVRREEEEEIIETAKITELTESYQQMIKELKSEHEIILKKISTELDHMTKNYNQKLLENKLLKSNTDNMMAQKQQESEEFQIKYKQLLEESKREQEQTKETISTKQKFYINKIEELTEQLENITEERNRQRDEMMNKTELGLKEMKNFYELEKERAENKLITQKEKYERKLKMLREEFDDKMKDQVSQLEDENERLRSEIMEMQEEFNKELSNRKIEFDIKSKNLESLEKSYEDLKLRFEQKQSEFSSRFQKQQKESKIQKQSLYAKIEQLLTSHSKTEKEKINLQHHKENMEKIITQKDNDLKEAKEDLSIIRAKIEKERQEFKNLKNQFNSKRNEERVELEKKVALLEQENIYIKKKMEQNEKVFGSEQESNEEKIRRIKEEYSLELKTEKEKNAQEFDTLEKKYDRLKKSSKETESTLGKTISQLEKQLAITKERLSNLNEKLSAFEEKSGIDAEQYNSQISTLRSSFYNEKKQLKELLEKEQQEKERIQSQKNSINASYQQEKILWENKIKFLEQNKEKAKIESESSKMQLESLIQKTRKKHATEKLALETAHSEKIVKLEKKYWTEKQELTENYKKQQSEFESKIKSLEFELRALQEKTAFEEQNKLGEINISEKKMKQMIENEKKLTAEIERLRTLRERENKEQLEIYEKEKTDLRQKNLDKDEKLKASQKQRQHLFYEIEKQRAKWGIQRDTIINKIEEQKEVIMKNQRDIEKLQRENQKLKVQKKCHKTSLNSMTRFGTGYGYAEKAGSSRSSFQDSVILKQNSNNSQISDTSIFFKE